MSPRHDRSIPLDAEGSRLTADTASSTGKSERAGQRGEKLGADLKRASPRVREGTCQGP